MGKLRELLITCSSCTEAMAYRYQMGVMPCSTVQYSTVQYSTVQAPTQYSDALQMLVPTLSLAWQRRMEVIMTASYTDSNSLGTGRSIHITLTGLLSTKFTWVSGTRGRWPRCTAGWRSWTGWSSPRGRTAAAHSSVSSSSLQCPHLALVLA